ncbi:MAG: hypothetical protein DI566_07760 [Microbacterium sp.]|nr:MAG: hypothetical protein DI566_07760 [Microbacterium sp.]
MRLPELYVHVGAARHFLAWELPHLAKYFHLVEKPSWNASLLAFGPDVIRSGASLPASHRFLTQFPGFGHNPLHDLAVRQQDLDVFDRCYERVFVNPGPLQIAYASSDRVTLFPVSIDVRLIDVQRNRSRERIASLLHVSSRTAQKDWRRSAAVMKKTGIPYEVFPPLDEAELIRRGRRSQRRAAWLRALGVKSARALPLGYVSHRETIRKYREYDGFVHIARDVRHPTMIDGKYTASLMEAALTGAIVFWHDTLGLGNDFETIFDAPASTHDAAEYIHQVRSSLNVRAHSRATAEEMKERADPGRSVAVRAHAMLEVIE